MIIKRVNILSKDYRKIKDIYSSSLPKDERIPSFLIYILSLKKNIHYLAFYEEEKIIGIMYAVETKKLNYLLYLVVNSECRSKGYGSKMLDWVTNKTKEKPVALDIERIEESAPNYAQRVKRLAFYERNGFYPTEYTVSYNNQCYTILANKDNFDINDYLNIFKSFPFNLYRTVVKK